ncbi:MAG: hypothetical protein ABI673_05595 [Novosphingobium sp.]
MPGPTDQSLRNQLDGIGITEISEQDRVIDVARRCTKTGIPLGAGWAVLGAPALAPGALVGFLTGFVTGTTTCVALSYAARDKLKQLGSGDLSTPTLP